MADYVTYFGLMAEVNDFDAAYRYLTEDDMTKYLKSNIEYDGSSVGLSPDSIEKIEWILEDPTGGVITLETTEDLTQPQLDYISEWIRGQNSDGLGEGFEQQPFAINEDYDYGYDEDDEYYEDDYTEMASFDWQTNNYSLRKVSRKKGSKARCKKSNRTRLKKKAQSSSYSIFIGAVADPTNGTWVDLPASDDEIQNAIETAQNGPDGEFYEEVMIADVSGLGNSVGEYDDIEQVNEWVFQMMNSGLPEDLVDTLLEDYDLETVAENADDIEFYMDVNSDSDLAYEVVDALGGIGELGNETLKMYFDYEEFGRDLRLGDGYEIANGFGFRFASRRTASRMMLCNIIEKHIRKAESKVCKETAKKANLMAKKSRSLRRSANRSRKNRRHLPLR